MCNHYALWYSIKDKEDVADFVLMFGKKPTQLYKAIILQLKINKTESREKLSLEMK